jgi:branched-chain amino acid transport system substrate-binding protein
MSRSIPSFSATIVAAVVLAACSKEPAPASGDNGPLIVKIGQASPLTGAQAAIGKDNENGARLALEDANAEKIKIGGRDVTFELVSEDDQADPKQGTLVAQKFVDSKVNAVIGHLNSGTTIPASKIYSDAGIAQISPSATNPTYTHQGFKTAFRVMANDEQQGKALGKFAVETLKVKSVAVIDDKTAYGEGLANEFRKYVETNGVKVVGAEHTDDKSVDFTAILTNLKAKKPEIVFYGGMYPQAGPMVAQMKKLGIDARLLTGDGGCAIEFLNLAGDAFGRDFREPRQFRAGIVQDVLHAGSACGRNAGDRHL